MVALLVVAGAFVAPRLIERSLVARMEQAAWSRGVDLRYGQLEWGLGGVVLREVRADHARGTISLRRVEVDVRWTAALVGQVHIERVRLVEPNAHVDLGVEEGSALGGRTTDASGDAGWPALPYVELIRPALTINDEDGSPLVTARGSRIVYDPDDGGHIQGAGSASIRGLGEQTLKIDGMYLGGELSVGVTPGREGVPLFDGAIDGIGRLVIGRGRVKGSGATGALSLRLWDVSGARGRWRYTGAKIEVEAKADGLEARVRGGRLFAEAAPFVGGGTGAAERPAIESRVRALAHRVRLDIEGVTVQGPGDALMENVSALWHRGHLDAWARFGGGEVEIFGEVAPWSLASSALVLQGRGLRLEAIASALSSEDGPGRERSRGGGRLDIFGAVTAAHDDLGRPLGWGSTRFDGWLSLRQGRIDAPGIADVPVTGVALDATLSGDLEARADGAEFEGWLSSGALQVGLSGRLETMAVDPTLDLVIKGDPVPCQAAFEAIPHALLGPYDRAQLEGTFAPRVRLHWPRLRPWALEMRFRDLFRACRVKALAARGPGRIFVRLGGTSTQQDDVDWLNRAFALRVREGLSDDREVWIGPGARGYVPLAQLPRYVGAAAYLSEEMGFYHNRPIDRGLITRALRLNLEHGRFVYGGSTVTQQLVKNLFLSRQKTLARKLQEVLIATRIITTVSRDRVLELYLNCIEFGPNVYGIGRAARYYFQKDARALSPREAVFLAMLKPAPRRGAWMKRRGYTPRMPYWQMRAEEIFTRLVDKGYLSAAQAQAERPYALRWEGGRYLDDAADAGP